MLKRLSTMLAAGALVAVLAPAAHAFAPAPLGPTTDIIQVREGCGPGFHRNRFGRCRPNANVQVCRRVRTDHGWRRICG